MFPTLQAKLARYEDIERLLQDPDVLANTSQMLELQKEHGGLGKVARSIREFNQLEAEIAVAKEMSEAAEDPSEREYAQSELAELQARYESLKTDLEDMVTAGDSLTRGSCIMEIRAGTGGDEAALFARDLFDMYTKFVERKGWKFEVLEITVTELAGLKEVVFSVTGEGAYHLLQFESGGHRVQRVPETEAQGPHTHQRRHRGRDAGSDRNGNRNPRRRPGDRHDAGRRTGRAESQQDRIGRATSPTKPPALIVRIQDEKSQHKNRAKAMRVLRSRTARTRSKRKTTKQRPAERRTLIGSGDRSRTHPHLQLPAKPADRSPHQSDDPQARPDHAGRSRGSGQRAASSSTAKNASAAAHRKTDACASRTGDVS